MYGHACITLLSARATASSNPGAVVQCCAALRLPQSHAFTVHQEKPALTRGRILRGQSDLKSKLAIAVRRWIVTLCVALVAFAAFGHMHEAAAQPTDQAVYAQSQQQDAPADESPAADHCCCAHSIAVEPLSSECGFIKNGGKLKAPRSDDFVLSRDPNGLDRPPRLTAAV